MKVLASNDEPVEAKVITVSDRVARGVAIDRSGAEVARLLSGAGFAVVEQSVSPDGLEEVARAIASACEAFTGVVITTGGTGFSPRDLTPEATRSVLQREAPGLSEAMRQVNPLGRLSRAVAGTIGEAIVINLPGSPSGAVECLNAVIEVLPHASRLLAGRAEH